MSENFTIKRCSRSEYPQFLDMINDAFGYGAENHWFEINMPICTPYESDATDEEIAKHLIAVKDGEVVGAVGAYPLEWALSENKPNGAQVSIKAFGIGQVSCKKELRGQSVMRSLLTRAIEESVEAGAYVSFLGGDRFRYGRFGYDFGGCSPVFEFSEHRLGQSADLQGLSVVQALCGDSADLNGMYAKLPSYIKRSEKTWERQLSSTVRSWFIGECNGKRAYICYQDKHGIIETQGDPEIIIKLILRTMHTMKREHIQVRYPDASGKQDPVYQILWQYASWVSSQPINLLALYEPEKLWEAMAPILANKDGGDLKTLFGFSGQPRMNGTPLIVWHSEADNI